MSLNIKTYPPLIDPGYVTGTQSPNGSLLTMLLGKQLHYLQMRTIAHITLIVVKQMQWICSIEHSTKYRLDWIELDPSLQRKIDGRTVHIYEENFKTSVLLVFTKLSLPNNSELKLSLAFIFCSVHGWIWKSDTDIIAYCAFQPFALFWCRHNGAKLLIGGKITI